MSTDSKPAPVPTESERQLVIAIDRDIFSESRKAFEETSEVEYSQSMANSILPHVRAHTSRLVAEAVQSRDAQIVVLLANLKEAQDTADTWFQRLSEMGCELTRDGSWRNVRAEMAVQSRDAQIVALREALQDSIEMIDIVADFEVGELEGPCAANRAYAVKLIVGSALAATEASYAGKVAVSREEWDRLNRIDQMLDNP